MQLTSWSNLSRLCRRPKPVYMKHYLPESQQGRQALRGFCSAKLNTLAFCSQIDLVVSFSWCPIIWCYWGGTYRYLSYYFGGTILHTQWSIFLLNNWAYDYTVAWFGTKLSKKMLRSEKCRATNNDKTSSWLVTQYVIFLYGCIKGQNIVKPDWWLHWTSTVSHHSVTEMHCALMWASLRNFYHCFNSIIVIVVWESDNYLSKYNIPETNLITDKIFFCHETKCFKCKHQCYCTSITR